MDCKNFETIEYFLFLKKKYINILSYLTEILNEYFEITNLNENVDTSLFMQYNKYQDEILEVKYMINIINNKISQICCHDFVKDEIDITPDRSQKIEYCKICEYTKDNGF